MLRLQCFIPVSVLLTQTHPGIPQLDGTHDTETIDSCIQDPQIPTTSKSESTSGDATSSCILEPGMIIEGVCEKIPQVDGGHDTSSSEDDNYDDNDDDDDDDEKDAEDAGGEEEVCLSKGRIQKILSWEWGCPDNPFLVFNIFHRGLYEPPSRSSWTLWVQLLLEGGLYHYF